MNQEKSGSIHYWEQHFDPERPYRSEPLTNRTVYLWSRQTAPMPSGMEIRVWEWFAEPEALLGYLRHVLLPSFFGVWLGRDEGEPESGLLISVEDLVSHAARSPESEYTEDIPLMRALVEKLDALFGKMDAQQITGAKEVASQFNQRWMDTPTWEFEIQIAANPVEVGEAVIRQKQWEFEDPDEFENPDAVEEWKLDWARVCGNALSDRQQQRTLLDTLVEMGSY